MSRRKLAAAAVGAAVLVAALLFWPTRERQVKRQMRATATWISKDEGEGTLSMASRASDAPLYFADPCRVTAEGYAIEGSFSPQELSRYALGAWSRLGSLRVRFYDVHVEFPEGDRAEVTATVRIRVLDRDGETTEETHEVVCTLVRREGRWLLEEVRLVQVLER